jgi:hypothetical protein
MQHFIWPVVVILSIAMGNMNALAAAPDWTDTFRGEDWFKAWSAKQNWGLKENCTAANGVLRIRFPKGSASPTVTRKDGAPTGGAQWYARPLPPQDELYLRYYVRFTQPFDFVKGGKLPGLFGGTEASGGKKPDGTNRFSTRFMWRTQGAGELYAYLFGQDDPYGVSLDRGKWKFQVGKWHCLEQHVRLNTPGKEDGVISVWFDSAKVLDLQQIRFRTVKSLQIEGILFSTFFGGNDASWAASVDSVIEFRDFALSKKHIGK